MYRTKAYLANIRAVTRKKDLEKIKRSLKLGRWYPVYKTVIGDGWKQQKEPTKIRLIGIYPFVATFEDENGIVMSFDYWKVNRVLRGEEIID